MQAATQDSTTNTGMQAR